MFTKVRQFIAKSTVVAGVLALGTSSAFAVEADYSALLTTNLTNISSIWAVVAPIMIAVTLVTVGLRFTRKAK